MNLFFSKVFNRKLKNSEVENAIEKLNYNSSNENRMNFYYSIRNAKLVIAVLSNVSNTTVLQEDISAKILTAAGPEGGTVILAFTSIEKLNKRKLGSNYIILKFSEIVEMVLRYNHDGLIINPNGPWAGIPKEDIIKYFQ